MTKEIFVPKENVPKDRFFIAPAEAYLETEAKIEEKFGGESRAYRTIMNGVNAKKGTGSQFFFNNAMNLFLPKSQSVIKLEDLDRIYGSEFFDGSFYTDLRDLILRTETSSYGPNKQILENLVKQVKAEGFDFNSENPLRILNLELIKDENPKNKYGLLLKIGQETKVISDKRFAYLRNNIQLGNKNAILYTKEHDLSRVYLDWDADLYSDYGSLDYSDDGGRVVLKDTVGVAPKNFVSEYEEARKIYLTSLKELRKKIDEELKSQ